MTNEKREYYSREDVVERYDAWRFGSAGGRHVDALERALVLELLGDLPRDASVLDMPCGTGRMLRTLADAGFTRLAGADFSPAMLARSAAAAPAARLTRQDALATDLPAGAFDAVVTLRFLFHLEDPAPLLREVARLLRPGGALVLDSIRWTPRGLLGPLDRRLGGRIHARPDAAVEAAAAAAGLAVVARRRALLLPSLAYRFLPAPLVAPLARAERHAPEALFTKTFFRLERGS